jgi:hypothetical protein
MDWVQRLRHNNVWLRCLSIFLMCLHMNFHCA